MKKRTLALILALVLVATAAVAGTMAWLMDTTQTVENTFTVGNIDITLTETDTDSDGNANENAYKMIPGSDIAKDPKVTVLKGSEECYVFVKVEKTNPVGKKDGVDVNYTVENFLEYTIDSSWTPLAGVEGVYYREQASLVGATSDSEAYSVLTGDKVTVNNTVTKDMMDAISADGATLPKLTFTAYAVQKANVGSAADAWEIALNNGAPVAP